MPPLGDWTTGKRYCGPDYSGAPRQFTHPRQNFLDAHLLPAMEFVRGIAPGASQVATLQTHEYARQARAGAFALNRFENFHVFHFCSGGLTTPYFSTITPPTPYPPPPPLHPPTHH